MEEGTAIEGPRTLAELDDAIADLQLRLSDYALAFASTWATSSPSSPCCGS